MGAPHKYCLQYKYPLATNTNKHSCLLVWSQQFVMRFKYCSRPPPPKHQVGRKVKQNSQHIRELKWKFKNSYGNFKQCKPPEVFFTTIQSKTTKVILQNMWNISHKIPDWVLQATQPSKLDHIYRKTNSCHGDQQAEQTTPHGLRTTWAAKLKGIPLSRTTFEFLKLWKESPKIHFAQDQGHKHHSDLLTLLCIDIRACRGNTNPV